MISWIFFWREQMHSRAAAISVEWLIGCYMHNTSFSLLDINSSRHSSQFVEPACSSSDNCQKYDHWFESQVEEAAKVRSKIRFFFLLPCGHRRKARFGVLFHSKSIISMFFEFLSPSTASRSSYARCWTYWPFLTALLYTSLFIMWFQILNELLCNL